MDPLDPLTEIVKSGQAFSPLIFLERFLWLMIGFFFIGSMTTGLRNGQKGSRLFNNKTSILDIDKKSDKKNSAVPKDGEENISKN